MNAAVIIPTLDNNVAHLSGNQKLSDCLAALDGAHAIIQHDEHREGFAVTCNKGAKEARDADVLVFLNDDTIPQPGWLDPLLEATERGVIAGARLTYPDGSLQHTGVLLRRDSRGRLEAYNRTEDVESGPVPAVTGACLAIRREHFDLLGGFDENYRNGYEDVDLCLRAGTGLQVPTWYAAESHVVHLESQSEGRFDHVAHNIDLLQRRWGWLPTT